MNKQYQPIGIEHDGSVASAFGNDSIVEARRGDGEDDERIIRRQDAGDDAEKVHGIFDGGEAAGNDIVVEGGQGAADRELKEKLQRGAKS